MARGSGMSVTRRKRRPKTQTRGPCPYVLAGIPCNGHDDTPAISFAEAMRERLIRPVDLDHPVYRYYTPTEPTEEQRSVPLYR